MARSFTSDQAAHGPRPLAGRRIAILSYGSRGDIQPFVALGTRLLQEGAKVLIITNIDHIDFVSCFGLEVAGAAGSCRDNHESEEFVHGVATGDFGRFFARQALEWKEKMPETTRKERQALQEFGPHLIYATPLTYRSSRRMSHELGVPMMLGSLFPAENQLSNLGFRPFRPIEHPTLIHFSPQLTEIGPRQTWLSKVTGFLVVGGQEQRAVDDGAFGGLAARRRLEDFLAAGPPPVYLGWGSMPVPPETACLAVRALMLAGLRGVVLGGWAKLTAEMLEGHPDAEELKAYAAAHVLFVQSAPHEWLFERCAVTVHHGGAGTVAAALRAGVPTVVTPCGLDQPENAKLVEASGCGLAMPQIASVTEETLAAALAVCSSDEEMQGRCREMAARLRSEDGLGVAAEEIRRYLDDQDLAADGIPVLPVAAWAGQAAQRVGAAVASRMAQRREARRAANSAM